MGPLSPVCADVRVHRPSSTWRNDMALVAGVDSSTQSCKVVVRDA
ncbi:MAG: hypothetical protein J0I40_11655, partial [Cellulomonas sp.]|nr:hypothetical protein [Cellulomonas sp.]